MNNDAITLNAIIDDLGRNVTALTELGQDGFNSPSVTLPHELKGMTGMPMGPRRVLSDDLIWYGALRVTIYARQLLEESERILQQIEDEDAAQKVGNILAVVDEENFELSRLQDDERSSDWLSLALKPCIFCPSL
jgi:hypothetical protein